MNNLNTDKIIHVKHAVVAVLGLLSFCVITDTANRTKLGQHLNLRMFRRNVSSFVVYLTKRFHFAARLYSDAQMTSKRGKNKEVRLVA